MKTNLLSKLLVSATLILSMSLTATAQEGEGGSSGNGDGDLAIATNPGAGLSYFQRALLLWEQSAPAGLGDIPISSDRAVAVGHDNVNGKVKEGVLHLTATSLGEPTVTRKTSNLGELGIETRISINSATLRTWDEYASIRNGSLVVNRAEFRVTAKKKLIAVIRPYPTGKCDPNNTQLHVPVNNVCEIIYFP